jgi:hypothetical protein
MLVRLFPTQFIITINPRMGVSMNRINISFDVYNNTSRLILITEGYTPVKLLMHVPLR